MTEKTEDLIAEARRLGQRDWCLSVPDIAKGVLNACADALEALTTRQEIDAPSVREAIGEVLADMEAVIDGVPVASDLVALQEITDAAIQAATSPPSRTAKRTGYETVSSAVGEHSQKITARAALTTPQEAAPVCAWCPLPARGDAWHNDGKLHPSCGQIGHGQGWVPPYVAPVAKPCCESDDDIRGRLSELLFTIYDHGTQPNALREADAILAAFPVLSRAAVPEPQLEWHYGRSWVGTRLEDECPCAKQPCGLVTLADAGNANCPQHAVAYARTMRQSHLASNCPGKPHTEHVHVAECWPRDCLEGECEHRDEDGQPEDMTACPATPMEVCVGCMVDSGAGADPSVWEDAPLYPWPCEKPVLPVGGDD